MTRLPPANPLPFAGTGAFPMLNEQVRWHFVLHFDAITPDPAKVAFFEPRSRGLPAGLLAQPFYGWVGAASQAKARFNGLKSQAEAQISSKHAKAC